MLVWCVFHNTSNYSLTYVSYNVCSVVIGGSQLVTVIITTSITYVSALKLNGRHCSMNLSVLFKDLSYLRTHKTDYILFFFVLSLLLKILHLQDCSECQQNNSEIYIPGSSKSSLLDRGKFPDPCNDCLKMYWRFLTL